MEENQRKKDVEFAENVVKMVEGINRTWIHATREAYKMGIFWGALWGSLTGVLFMFIVSRFIP